MFINIKKNTVINNNNKKVKKYIFYFNANIN